MSGESPAGVTTAADARDLAEAGIALAAPQHIKQGDFAKAIEAERAKYLGTDKAEIMRGFTLIEMSIVLVIIGLLAAGITGGQALIEQAGIRSTVTDINEIRQSVNAFLLQYNAKPGDLGNATSYWPSGSTGDGDENGTIERGTPREWLFSWQHLVLSDIYPGAFDGENTDTTSAIGVNVPESAIQGGGFDIFDTSLYGTSGNWLGLASDGGSIDASLLTPGQARNIDKKLDDGESRTGTVIGLNGDGDTGCESGTDYDVSSDSVVCRIMVYLD